MRILKKTVSAHLWRERARPFYSL